MEYKISKLRATNWDNFSEQVVAVVRDQGFAHFRKLKSLAELRTILDLLNDHGEKKMLFDTCFSSSYIGGKLFTFARSHSSIVKPARLPAERGIPHPHIFPIPNLADS